MEYDNNLFVTLYLNITEDCNLQCDYCKLWKPKGKTATLSDMITAVEKVKPSHICITGGEPIFYQDMIKSFIRFYEAGFRRLWDVTLCTNLSKLPDDELLKMINNVQYTYSIDRIKRLGKEQVLDRLDYLKDKTNLSTIITLTEQELKEDPIEFGRELLTFPSNMYSFEPLSFSEDLEDGYYNRVDEFLYKIYDIIPIEKNYFFHKIEKNKAGTISIDCNSCDIGCAFTMKPDGEVIKQCNCGIPRNSFDRKQKFLNMCVNCEYFKQCKVGCERYGSLCAFPKKTYKKYIKGEFSHGS